MGSTPMQLPNFIFLATCQVQILKVVEKQTIMRTLWVQGVTQGNVAFQFMGYW